MSIERSVPSDETLLKILQYTKEPTAVYVSAELHIGFINRSMMDLWQKTSPIVGMRLVDAAPEFGSFIPILHQVWQTGHPYIAIDTPANIDHNGQLIERYFDFEYRPVLDIDGKVEAIINTATDVTDRLAAKQRLKEKDRHEEDLKNELIATNQELIATQERLAEINLSLQLNLAKVEETENFLYRFIMQAPAALTLLRGPKLVYDILNPRYQQFMPGRELKGRSIFDALPELIGTELEGVLHKVYHEGLVFSVADSLVPLADVEYGPTQERYFTFNFVPWYNDQGKIDGIMNLAYEVTDEVKARQDVIKLNGELQQVNAQLNMAAEAARIGTWFIEPDSKSLKYNSVLADIFGYEGAEAMTYDQAIAQVMPEYRDHLVNEIDHAIKNGNYYDVTYQHKRFNDGKVIWLRSTGQVSKLKGNSELAFSGVVQDISRQRLEEERKDTFIGMVSHELKTPLTSLNGFVQILQQRATRSHDEFSETLLGKTARQVSKMTKMINGFLNVSRLESGNIQIQKDLFDIVDVIREVAEESALVFPANELEFVASDSVKVIGDKDKIGQVINNLVSNAVKYSPNGSKVRLTYGSDNTQLTLSVEDQGIGIPTDDIDKLFTRYYRVDNQVMRTVSGFGIGLYLCKEIIEQHGGCIGVVSTLGSGSRFWFSLPLSGN